MTNHSELPWKVVLERKKIQAQEFLSRHALRSLSVEQIEDVVLGGLMIKLKTEILAETEPKELYVVVFKIHKNWWEQFKEEKLPKWLLKNFPVKYIFAKKYLTIHREAWYPKLNKVFPETGSPIIKTFVEEKEIRNY